MSIVRINGKTINTVNGKKVRAIHYGDKTWYLEEPQTGYTLTLNVSTTLNSTYYTYSLDGGTTWNQFTSETVVLENVETIKFKNTENTTWYTLGIGTFVAVDILAVDIATAGGLGADETDDLTLTENTTWYIYRISTTHGGGSND